MVTYTTSTPFPTPDFDCTCFLKNFPLSGSNELRVFMIEWMKFMSNTNRWHSPVIPNVRIELHSIGLLRHVLDIGIELHETTKILALKLLVGFSPSRGSGRAQTRETNGMVNVKVVNVCAAQAANEVLPLVYREPRRSAAQRLSNEALRGETRVLWGWGRHSGLSNCKSR